MKTIKITSRIKSLTPNLRKTLLAYISMSVVLISNALASDKMDYITIIDNQVIKSASLINQPLNKEAADRLVQGLKDECENSLDDFMDLETVKLNQAKIISTFSNRGSMVGKTVQQVVELFLSDAKSHIDDPLIILRMKKLFEDLLKRFNVENTSTAATNDEVKTEIREIFVVDRENEIYDINWLDVLNLTNVPEMNGVSSWSAAASTLVSSADGVIYKRSDVKKKIGYWKQFESAYPTSDLKTFENFKLSVNERQFNTPEQLLNYLNRHGPIVVCYHNRDHARVITGMKYNKQTDTYLLKIFDTRPRGRAQMSRARLLVNKGSTYVETFEQFKAWEVETARVQEDVTIWPVIAYLKGF